jgi:hypothetical protein
VEHLGRRVRVEDVEISDRERNYGRRYAGRVGEIQQASREPSPPGAIAPGGIAHYTVRLDDGELLTLKPEEVRQL